MKHLQYAIVDASLIATAPGKQDKEFRNYAAALAEHQPSADPVTTTASQCA